MAKSGKRYLIVDPTSEKTAFGQLEHGLQGGYAVIVEGRDSEVVQLPVLSPELNTIRRSATFQLQPDGSIKGAIVEKRFGDVSEHTRYLYAYGDQKERKKYLDNRLKRDFTSFNVSDLKVEDVGSLNKDVTTSFTLAADRFGRTMGPLLMVRPRVLGLDGFALDHKARKIPIDLEQTMVAVFDPGQRYCGYGNLGWNHTVAGGLRQTATGTEVTGTSASSYKSSHASRIADLTLDEHGSATGTVTLSYTGDTALHWRQEALRGDDTSLNSDLKSHLEAMLPGGMEVRVTKVDNLNDADKPLTIACEVKGAIGSPTGRRLLIVSHLFEVNSKPKFHETKRELAIDMRYPSMVQDAVRLKLPPTLEIESLPPVADAEIAGSAKYTTSAKKAASSVTLYRNLTIGKTIFLPAEYPDLRAFYGKVEAKDQEALVLTRVAQAAAEGTN